MKALCHNLLISVFSFIVQNARVPYNLKHLRLTHPFHRWEKN